MEEKTASQPGKARAKDKEDALAYSTFPHVATNGASNKRCYHGKPADWERNPVKRNFGAKGK
jgi:hypothetical protein